LNSYWIDTVINKKKLENGINEAKKAGKKGEREEGVG
jgi:hypothetical protein